MSIGGRRLLLQALLCWMIVSRCTALLPVSVCCRSCLSCRFDSSLPSSFSFVRTGAVSTRLATLLQPSLQLYSSNHNQDVEEAHEDNDSLLWTKNSKSMLSSTLFATIATAFVISTTATIPIFLTVPSVAHAGEVGAKITKAVTTSDLGISVRTSVVKGAQIMDRLDGQWEKLSDKYALGSERSKQPNRPKPKVIPQLQPLNVKAAQQVLEISDQAFLQASDISSPSVLQKEIENVAQLVKVSFERSGVTLLEPFDAFRTGPQFNFVVYTHFKAYSNLLLEQQQRQPQDNKSGKSFMTIRSNFERMVGQKLMDAWHLKKTREQSTSSSSLETAMVNIQNMAKKLQDYGFVALVDPSTIDPDDWQDFLDGATDLNWNVALDGVRTNARTHAR